MTNGYLFDDKFCVFFAQTQRIIFVKNKLPTVVDASAVVESESTGTRPCRSCVPRFFLVSVICSKPWEQAKVAIG